MSVELWSGFISCLVGAVTMGFSCGTGCSPAISVYLTSYVMQIEGDKKQAAKGFLQFFGGKAAAVVFVCLLASVLGTAFVSTKGYFNTYDLSFLMPLFLLISGIYTFHKVFKSFYKKGCSGCQHCKVSSKNGNNGPLLGGFLYGLTPCAPLILLAGYAISMPLYMAVTLAIVFSAACTISPLIIVICFTRLITVKMREEVPKMFQVVQCVMSAMVAFVGAYLLITL